MLTDKANREFLRTVRPDLYRRAVEIGHIVTHHIDSARSQRAAAEVESAVMQLLADALEQGRTT